MKTIKLGSIAMLALFVIVSCTKESSLRSSSVEVFASANKAGGGVQTSQADQKKPVLTASQSPKPVRIGNDVTVTYTAASIAGVPVDCGKIIIYKVAGGIYTEVASGAAPSVSYTFKPATAEDCAYQFVAGFAPGGGTQNCQGAYAGVSEKEQTPFCVDVEDCVSEFTVDHNVTALDLGGGLYEFTVTYKLTSPVDVAGVHFQGGATSGGKFQHEITYLNGLTIRNANNQNSVLQWDGNLSACSPLTLSFKYKRLFSCGDAQMQVTGDWKASKGEEILEEIAPLTYSCSN